MNRCDSHKHTMEPKGWRWWFHEGLDHFKVALILFSVVVILEHHGWMNWLDSLSLRAASTMHFDLPFGGKDAPAVQTDRPLTILISDEMFEREFKQISPLDRDRLAELIDPILAGKPKNLVIDLDLSPGPGDTDASGQTRLNNLLMERAGTGTRIVLASPFPVLGDELLAKKLAWMVRLCDAGVDFAYPFLLESQGLVLRYPGEIETIGRVTRREHTAATEPETLCFQAKQGVAHAAFLDKNLPVDFSTEQNNFETQHLLNPAFFDAVDSIRLSQLTDIKAADLNGRTIVLGSGFNANDQFNTAFGKFEGAVLHAATIYSETYTTKSNHYLAAFLDLGIGVLAGFLFHWTWGFFFHIPSHLLRGNGKNWLAYTWQRGWLLISIASFGMVVVALAMASGALFRNGWWINPGPMILGLFVKSLIASRPHAEQAPPRGIDDWLFGALVIYAFFLFFDH